jgi:DNA repair exonuclease SbcCD ATPase subunit
VEAASIAWRPLGRLLVEQGLLTDEELELALAKQQLTGKRLGETIVECGFVSRPELSNALAAQYGIELKTETGFGTGLRAQIQQRHESDRGRVVQIGLARPIEPVELEVEVDVEMEPEVETVTPESQQSAELLAQLEEQWAKLAAAEEQLAEREAALAAAVVERDGRRAQAERLARLARAARAEQSGHRERRRALMQRFMQRVRDRDDEIQRLTADLERYVRVQQATEAAADERRAELERALERVAAQRDRRRAQAGRFLGRARERDDETQRLTAELQTYAHELQTTRTSVDERHAELERALALVAAQRDRRRAQAGRFLQRARARDAELERCEEELRRLGQVLGGQADEHRAVLAAGAQREVGLERALAELATDWDRRHAQAGRFARRARGLAEVVDGLRGEVERLDVDVHGCDAELERLREENGRRRAQTARFAARLRARPDAAHAEPAAPTSHLVFVQAAAGYSLVERDGPPPARHTPLELPDLHDGVFVVSGRRRSPLPGDARPCVVAEPS